MNKKEKPKRGAKMGILRSCLIFLLYPFLILIVLGIGLVYWAIGGYVKPSLDTQYILTAEYLLENPIEEPPWDESYPHLMDIRVKFSQDPPLAGWICFVTRSSHWEDFDNLKWAEVYINEQIVSRVHWDWPAFVYEQIPLKAFICLQGHLDSGLHIIEFRAKESLFAEPYYIHRWAIEID